MTFLRSWIETPLAYALGSTLAHFVWEGTLIALVLAAILHLCRPSSARLRYTWASIALLAMPVVFGVTLALSWPAKDSHAMVARGANAIAAVFMPQGASGGLAIEERIRNGAPWLAPFWIAGVFLFYARSLTGWIGAQRLRRIGVCAAPVAWQERLHRLADEIRLSRPVVLLESCLTEAPVVIGFFRPVILLPLGLITGYPAEQLEYILIHELAHILRRDYLVNLLQSVVEGLLFYHPAAWWVSGLVRTERENCCDDAVVALRGDARGYAAALAALEQGRGTAHEPVLAATGGSLLRRIRRLLHEPEWPRVAAAPFLFAGLLLVSVGAGMGARQTKPVVLFAQAPAANPYMKWLDEDVVYIINDQERAAFQQLRDDEERKHFIEQFWLRRDPTPDTPANEYLEEHYRRIGYSFRFSTSAVPGWKTDRGRFYIALGPPDEIESHPSGDATNAPWESWRYRYIEGIGNNVTFRFTDANRTGDYLLNRRPAP